MKKAPFILLLLTLTLILSACIQTADRVAAAVQAYCTLTSDVERALLRERVSSLIAPNTLKIECAKGPTPQQ